MPELDPLTIFDAARSAGAREAMATALGTEGLRDLGAQILARSAFTARGTSAIYAQTIKDVVDQLAAGDIGEGQARTALWETLKALGYTPEGGFPDAPPGSVPPALAGTLQDLMSFRRRDLIIRTQIGLMRGAGEQTRGHTPDRLAQFPAWELVRIEDKRVPRDWPARWVIAGGKLYNGRMIALKGDPVWGELGSYDNFPDALGVDHPPFAFESGKGWDEIARAVCDILKVVGPNGESIDEWFHSGVIVMAGALPLPTPRLSLAGVDPAIVDAVRRSTGATSRPATPAVLDYSDILERSLRNRDALRRGKQP